jgi:hypothetical protein
MWSWDSRGCLRLRIFRFGDGERNRVTMNLTSVATGLVLEFCDWDAFSELLGYKTDLLLFCELGEPDRWGLGP